MWRQNRNPNAGSACIGTVKINSFKKPKKTLILKGFEQDLNRNYGYFWNTGGSSALPCSDTYHGGAPWSQRESAAARDAILAITNGQVYVAMHSYSEDMLYPWGMTYDQAPNNDELVSYCTSILKTK